MFRSSECHPHLSFLFILFSILFFHLLDLLMLSSCYSSSILDFWIILFPFLMLSTLFTFLLLCFLLIILIPFLVLSILILLHLILSTSWRLVALSRVFTILLRFLSLQLATFLSFEFSRLFSYLNNNNSISVLFCISINTSLFFKLVIFFLLLLKSFYIFPQMPLSDMICEWLFGKTKHQSESEFEFLRRNEITLASYDETTSLYKHTCRRSLWYLIGVHPVDLGSHFMFPCRTVTHFEVCCFIEGYRRHWQARGVSDYAYSCSM